MSDQGIDTDWKVRGWHSRGYLPHFDGGQIPQFVTFRLADSLPSELLNQLQEELDSLSPEAKEIEQQNRIHGFLDRGIGKCWLERQDVASIVEDALSHFDGQRYLLHAWVIMPNHVHVLFTCKPGINLSDVVRSWKSFTAKKINAVLERTGTIWQSDYFDRYIRNEKHFADIVEYIENNPVKAGLCAHPQDWKHSSAKGNLQYYK